MVKPEEKSGFRKKDKKSQAAPPPPEGIEKESRLLCNRVPARKVRGPPESKTIKNFKMEQLNRIELRGIVGNSNVRTVGDRKTARFSLATDYVYKGKNGDPVIETSWHSVQAWEGKNIPDVSLIEKGMGVYVVGRYRVQKYQTQDGVDKTSYEVMADKVTILDERPVIQSNR